MSNKDLKTLLELSYRNNLEHKITGLLLYAGNHFMQTIEGPTSEILTLFDNIQADNRNKDVTVLNDRDIEEREFPGWSMGFRSVPANDFEGLIGLHPIHKAADLDAIPANNTALFSYMRSFYINNSGLGG